MPLDVFFTLFFRDNVKYTPSALFFTRAYARIGFFLEKKQKTFLDGVYLYEEDKKKIIFDMPIMKIFEVALDKPKKDDLAKNA